MIITIIPITNTPPRIIVNTQYHYKPLSSSDGIESEGDGCGGGT